FSLNPSSDFLDEKVGEVKSLYPGLERAILQAEKAQKMKIKDRLKKYSIGACNSGDLCTVSFYEDKIRKGCENRTPASTSKDNSKYFFCSEDMRNSYKNGASANISLDWEDIVEKNMERKRKKDWEDVVEKNMKREGEKDWEDVVEKNMKRKRRKEDKIENSCRNGMPPSISNDSSTCESLLLEGRALHEAIEEIRKNVLPSTQKLQTYIILPYETSPVIDTNESSSNEGTIIYENEESDPDSEQFIKNSPLLHEPFDEEFFSPPQDLISS
ncbi:hypothetical protein TNCT_493821, partial [Trichonephila clavata]